MFFFQQLGPNQKIPLVTKLALVFWIILSLALLSFFAFSIFLIALMVGLVLFTANLFQKKRGQVQSLILTSKPGPIRHHPAILRMMTL